MSVCILTAALVLRNTAQGKEDRHGSMVVEEHRTGEGFSLHPKPSTHELSIAPSALVPGSWTLDLIDPMGRVWISRSIRADSGVRTVMDGAHLVPGT
jgi:hypothetical protein